VYGVLICVLIFTVCILFTVCNLFTVCTLFCMCMGVLVRCVRFSNMCICIYCMYLVLYVYGCCKAWMYLKGVDVFVRCGCFCKEWMLL
jgi:hypothetical protein